MLSSNGTLHWWAGTTKNDGFPFHKLPILVYLTGYLSALCNIPNQVHIYRPAKGLEFATLDSMMRSKLNLSIDSSSDQLISSHLDVLTPFWAYTAYRHTFAYLPAAPLTMMEISSVISLYHIKPLSGWHLLKIFDVPTWLTIAAHFLLIGFVLKVIKRPTYGRILTFITGTLCGQSGESATALIDGMNHSCGTRRRGATLPFCALVYFLWFCFAIRTLFSQVLLDVLVNREESNYDCLDDAIRDQVALLLINPATFAYKVVLEEFVRSNPDRYQVYEDLTLDLFFPEDRIKRAIGIRAEKWLRLTQEMYPEVKLHLGNHPESSWPTGLALNRKSFKPEEQTLEAFLTGVIRFTELGLNQYQLTHFLLSLREHAVNKRLSSTQPVFTPDGGDSSRLLMMDSPFEALTVDHLKLAFALLAGPLLIVSLIVTCNSFKSKFKF